MIKKNIYAEVVERVEAKARQLVVGDPFDARVNLGPVVNRAACERILGLLDHGRKENKARLVVGGGRVGGEFAQGYYIEPTVFADVDPSSSLAQQEIFGPVLCISPFKDEAEAVATANSTQYGLSAYIQTANLARTLRLASELRTGTVYVNGAMMIQPAAPFGGQGLSGYGREGAKAGLDEYLRMKTVAIANTDS